jgi:hypothetical protein
VVSEDGVDIRRRFRWRRLQWDEIDGVEPPSRWGPEDVRVRTTSGESVKLDVPLRLADEFPRYASDHGVPASPAPDDQAENEGGTLH